MEVLYKKVYEKTLTTFHKDHTEIPKEILSSESFDPFQSTEYTDFHVIRNCTNKHPYFKYLSTSSQYDDFKTNYGNPMCSVQVSRMTVVVEKSEDKISLKLFLLTKHRQVGRVYFQKETKVFFLTYNHKTNCFYSGFIINGYKKRNNSRSIKKNYFAGNPVATFISRYKNNLNSFVKTEDIIDSFSHSDNFLSIFLNNILGQPEIIYLSHDQALYLNYLRVRNIKYPNNYLAFFPVIPLPNKRILKKTKYKLVEAVMLQNGLKGDKIKKVLHKCDNLNFEFFKRVQNFFGEEFIRHQPESDLYQIMSYKNGWNFPIISQTFSEQELKNIYQVFIISVSGQIHYSSLIDHITFYVFIKTFEDIKWKSNNISSFNKEHMDWTNKYEYYTKGTFTRTYDERFCEFLKEKIETKDKSIYYPILLFNSEQYNKESNIQSNCVKTYIDRAGSIIISLRKGSSDSEERATIEYQIGLGINEKLILRRRQSLGRFNQNLNEEWNEALDKVDELVNKSTKYFTLPKIKVETGGGNIESESVFDEKKHYVHWVSPFVNKISPSYQIRNNHGDIMDIDFEL